MTQTKLAIVAALGLAFAFVLSGAAHESQPDGRPQRDWEAFLDGVMAAQQQSYHFAGAVVVA